MNYDVKAVETEQDKKDFLEVPLTIYKGDPNWIRPLDKDIEKVFDKKRNSFFKHGELQRWLIRDEYGALVGRVAAFINKRTVNKDNDQPTGGMGFFECVNDKNAAFALFDTCKNWLSQRGMEAMDGPINFGERNEWWGLLVDGFTPPVYMNNYHPPYYKDLFESYGFKMYFRQYTYGLAVNADRPSKYYKRAADIAKNPDYSFSHVDKKNLPKYAEDFRIIYNKAWGTHSGFRQMKHAQAMKIMKAMKPVMIDYMMYFGYFKGDPVAMFICLPELNQYFKHVNGKLDWIGKLKFLWHSQIIKSNRRFFGLVFGVVPEHQGKGVEGAVIMAMNEVLVPKKRWDYFEMTWIGDFNPKMMRVAENLNAHIDKTHITYRYLFDPNAAFKRSPIIEH